MKMKKVVIEPFAFDEATRNEPTEFELFFRTALTEYRYENDYDGAEAIEIDGRRYYLLHTDDRTRVLTVYGNALYDISFHCGPEITKEILFTYY